MDRLPSTLFDALSTKDLDGMIYLYALSGRSALTRIARFAGVSTSVTDPQFSSEDKARICRSSSSHLHDDHNAQVQQTEQKLFSVSRDLNQLLVRIRRARTQNILSPDNSYNQNDYDEAQDPSHVHAGMKDHSPSIFTETSQKTPFVPTFFVDPSITVSQPAKRSARIPNHLHPSVPRLKSWMGYNSNISSATLHSSLNDIVNNEIEVHLFDRAASLTNTRPNSSFVMYNDILDGSKSVHPIFDGAVANATPQGIHGGGGGSGTILHLACAIDSPLALAILLVMGGDPSCRHTAFRRTILHETACANAPNCLRFLLEHFAPSLPSTTEDDMLSDECKDEMSYELQSTIKHDLVPDFALAKDPSKLIAPRGLSFVKTLNLTLDLYRQVQENSLSEIAAASILIKKVPLTVFARSYIEAACNMTEDNFATQDGHGNTVLHWASFKNCFLCAKILLSHGANPNSRAKTSEWTPLHDAAYSNSVDTLSLLISAGGDVNAKAKSGATPLCFAAQEDGPEAAEVLLKAGADPTIRCFKESGILGHGNDQHVYNHVSRFSGYTPLHYCAHYNAYKTAKTVLKFIGTAQESSCYPPLLEIPDLNNRLPIHIAVSRGNSDVLRQFLHFGQRVETASYCHEDTSAASIDTHTSSPNSHQDRSLSSISVSSNQDEDVVMDGDIINSSPTLQRCTFTFSPVSVSSPTLRSMIPSEPLESPKPWNCISQRSIDECKMLIQDVELYWSPERHSIFHPRDRQSACELLRVGKRLEQEGTGLFLELWPLVLSFCGRGWFEPETDGLSKQIVFNTQ